VRNCDASAAHWSSSKTHLFNNIEGSFSKATDDPWRTGTSLAAETAFFRYLEKLASSKAFAFN
jgi:hypothetical protein